MVCMRSRPTHPPSAVALAPVEHPGLIAGLKEVCKNKSLFRLTIANAIFIGFVLSLNTFISSIFSPFGYTPYQICMIGVTMLVGGAIGSVITGIILDRTQAYKRVIQVLMLSGSLVTGLVFHQIITGGSIRLIYCLVFIMGLTI